LVLGLLILISQFSILNSFGQDRPTVPAPVLTPFRPGGNQQPVNDEQLAMQLYQARDYVKAAEVYQRLYDKIPGNYYYTYLLFCLVETREFSQAEKLVVKQQKNEKRFLRYLADLGYIYYREGIGAKAKKHYEEAIGKLEADAMQITDLANAFVTRGEMDYALRTYARGRELTGNPYAFSMEMASIYERGQDYQSAFTEYLNLLEVNRTYLSTVEDRLQNLLAEDKENEKSTLLRKTLLARVQKDPEKIFYSELLMWYSIQQKDFSLALIQAKALDRRLREKGERILDVASLAGSNGDWDAAIQAYSDVVSKGPGNPYYDFARAGVLNMRFEKTIATPGPSGKILASLEEEFLREMKNQGENAANIAMVKNLARLDAFYLGKQEEAAALLTRAVELPGLTEAERAECKLDLADILVLTGDVWEASLLYQQVYKDFKNDVLGQEAKFRSARLSYYIGEFAWARTQLDILKAATSKLIANDAMALSLLISENYDPDSNTVALGMYARSELLDYRNEEEAAIRTLDSIPVKFSYHSIFDRLVYRKAEIRKKQGLLHEADSLLAKVVADYPDGTVADEALAERAELNAKYLGNKERAMELYQELLEKYPSSIFVPDARKRYRELRGDK
jgi:predicted Zn-dependent protease